MAATPRRGAGLARLIATGSVTTVLVASVLVSGGRAGADQTAASGSYEGPPPVANLVGVHGFVTGGLRPLYQVGGAVEVRSTGGRVLGKATTGRVGVALVPVQKAPRSLLVSVTGGRVGGRPFAGTMRALIQAYRSPNTVCVNPITTLVAQYQQSKAGVSLSQASAQVKRYLNLPAWYDPGCGTLSDAYFDGARFLADASHHGGFQKYVSSIAAWLAAHPTGSTTRYEKLRPSSPQHVATSETTTQVGSGASSPGVQLVARVTANADLDGSGRVQLVANTLSPSQLGRAALLGMEPDEYAAEFAPDALITLESGEGVLSLLGATASGVGIIAGIFTLAAAFSGGNGPQGPTISSVLATLQSDFQGLQNQVTALQQSVDNIQGQITTVEQSLLQTGTSSIVSAAEPMLSSINTIWNQLTTLTADAYQLACDGGGTSASGSACSTTQAIAQVCPAGTVLSFDIRTNKVVYPQAWGTTQKQLSAGTLSPLATQCLTYYEHLYGSGGFVPSMTSAFAGGNPAGFNFSNLGTLNGYVNGTGGAPGILQYTSMGTVVDTRFYDSTASAITQAVFDYYLNYYVEMAFEDAIYSSLIGQPASNVDTNLSAQPSLEQFEAFDPSTVPAGTVVDAASGLMWEQQIEANVSSEDLTGSGVSGSSSSGQGFENTPSTITTSEISTPNGNGLPNITCIYGCGTASSLNLAPGAVTPLDPSSITVGIQNGATTVTNSGTAFSDWYAATPTQLSTIFATPTADQPGSSCSSSSSTSTPTTGSGAQPTPSAPACSGAVSSNFYTFGPTGTQTPGDWLQDTPENQTNPGAGISAALFGANNSNLNGSGTGLSVSASSQQFQTIGGSGYCFDSGACFNENVASNPAACTLAGNTGCASPSYASSGGIFDLNNGNAPGAFNGAVSAVNWSSSQSYCTDVYGIHPTYSLSNGVGNLEGQCEPGDTVTYENIFSAIDGGGGWVTWFYRTPTSSECYFYLPPGGSTGLTQDLPAGATSNAAACPTSPSSTGYNGILSQTLFTSAGSAATS